MPELFDVIAISIRTSAERTIAERKTAAEAQQIVNLPPHKRGTCDEICTIRETRQEE
jgi:hypothetical protein